MSWWNPIDWVKDAWHDGANVEEDIRRWVTKVVRQAADLVERDAADALHLAEHALDSAIGGVSSLATEAYQGVGALGEAIWSVSGVVLDQAEAFAGEAVRGVEALVIDSERAVAGELDHLVRDVIDPVVSFVDGADRWVAGKLDGALHLFYRDVVHPIEHGLDVFRHDTAEAFDVVRHDVATSADWIEHEGKAAVHLVERAADWLEWLGAHALREVEELPGEVIADLSFDRLLSWLATAEPGLAEELDRVAGRVFR